MSNPPPLPKNSPPPLPQGADPSKPKERFTLPGIVLVLATIVGTAAGGVYCAFWLFPRILPGGHYPVLLLAVPIVGCGVAVMAVGGGVYKLLGIKVTVPIDEKPNDKDRAA